MNKKISIIKILWRLTAPLLFVYLITVLLLDIIICSMNNIYIQPVRWLFTGKYHYMVIYEQERNAYVLFTEKYFYELYNMWSDKISK